MNNSAKLALSSTSLSIVNTSAEFFACKSLKLRICSLVLKTGSSEGLLSVRPYACIFFTKFIMRFNSSLVISIFPGSGAVGLGGLSFVNKNIRGIVNFFMRRAPTLSIYISKFHLIH